MPGHLFDQLLEAGLVTEAQVRATDSGDPSASPSGVIQRLVAGGLDELTLAGFFVTNILFPTSSDRF